MLVKEEHGGEVVVVVVIWKGQTRHAEGTLQEFSARQVPLLLPFPSLPSTSRTSSLSELLF